METGEKKLLLEEMSWLEIEEAVKNEMTTVIIFAGSVEQHGPHMAEITDTLLGYHWALDLAKRLGNALVAPVIRPGLSEHHMSLPGTITLRPEVFIGIVEDYISSYIRHGFKTIILGSSHGGNSQALSQIIKDHVDKHEGVKIISGMFDFMSILKKLEKEDNLPAGTYGGHACACETSIMLHIAPQLVNMEKAECGLLDVTPDAMKKLFAEGMAAISKNGVLGDSRPARSDRGAAHTLALQDKLEEAIRAQLKE